MRDLGLQQPFPVLREHRRHPHWLVHSEPNRTIGTASCSGAVPSAASRSGSCRTPAAEVPEAIAQVQSTAARPRRKSLRTRHRAGEHIIDDSADQAQRMLRRNSFLDQTQERIRAYRDARRVQCRAIAVAVSRRHHDDEIAKRGVGPVPRAA